MPAPEISPYDAAWPVIAREWLAKIEASLTGLDGSSSFTYEHIGSTAVPRLAAKPVIDLQIRTNPLPTAAELEGALAVLGFTVSSGSRPDSPGVYFDTPRPGMDPDPAKHRKHLLFRPSNGEDPALILHVRRQDSPFAGYVLAFRDWLHVNPDEAREYEAVKRTLAEDHGSEHDYDDYTRAKTAFLDQAQTRMAAGTGLTTTG